jgi:PEGA domain-containing protein
VIAILGRVRESRPIRCNPRAGTRLAPQVQLGVQVAREPGLAVSVRSESGWSLRAWRSARSKRRAPSAPAGAVSPPLFQDGFGARWLAADPETGDAVEILSFAPSFAEEADFASLVGERVARLSQVRHTMYARARRLDRPAENALLLYADRVAGWRLADVLGIVEREKLTVDISAILALMRQLIPAVGLFSRHQRDAAIGTIGPERLILTPQGRLVLTDYALASGLEKMHLSRERLWRELRVVLPHAANPSRIPPAADVVGIGMVALTLLLGRLLKEDEYLVGLGDLLDAATETSGGETRRLSAGFGAWISRALQFDEANGFKSTQEAQVAFEEMLAKERAYVTTQTQLDLFIAKIEKIAGAPAELPAPPPPPIVPVKEPAIAARPDSGLHHAVAAAPIKHVLSVESVRSEAPPAIVPPTVSERVSGARAWLTKPALALAAIALFEAGVIGWLMTRDANPTLGPDGELVIQSRPVAARVAIDGEERGITPLTTPLTPGAHIVEVRVGRSEPRVIPLEIRAGVQSGLYVELQSVATVGGLDVRSEPNRARVTVDGRYRGDTPLVLNDLPPGDHEVLLEAGRQKIRQSVRVEPGITSRLVVPLGR